MLFKALHSNARLHNYNDQRAPRMISAERELIHLPGGSEANITILEVSSENRNFGRSDSSVDKAVN